MLISIMHNLATCRPVASVEGGQRLTRLLLHLLMSVWASYEKQQLRPPRFFHLSRLPRSQSLHAANYIHGNWIDEELSKSRNWLPREKGGKRWGSVLVSFSFPPPVFSRLSSTWWQCRWIQWASLWTKQNTGSEHWIGQNWITCDCLEHNTVFEMLRWC